ncbi:hypothetical protein D0544_00810 [Aestuariirhabdus litorea]|uniref:ABC transporter substrate-binding protein n=1 Tax=Aestuariirhabdus litorea TaxID=2528527 RepID=A0A3P3VMP7_9GAMM|nr:hypothetical protein D0544_00810 [Aestuariirhabdus litorea]
MLLGGILLLAGCAQLAALEGKNAAPPEVIDRSKVTPPPASRPVTSGRTATRATRPAPQKPQPATPVHRPPPAVAILVSADIDAMNEVATRVQKRLGSRASIHPLKGNALLAAELVDRLREGPPIQVVALGLLAAQASKSLPYPQVFAQVFNFAEYGLLREGRQGVSMLPPADQVFRFWRELSPGLRQVAVATGPNQQQLVKGLEQGAKKAGVSLQHIEVHSDKELIYALKQAEVVQGIWLLPDNRVLSRRVIRELMVFAVKNGKQLAVFSEPLLEGGALLSFSATSEDITERILDRLELLRHETGLPSELIPLKGAEIRINPVVASRLGVRIPASLKSHTLVQPAHEP